MSQQMGPQTIRIKMAVLIFLKNVAAPLVVYFDEPDAIYNELKEYVNNPVSKVLEFEPSGPVKKVCINANQITGVALQEEQYIVR